MSNLNKNFIIISLLLTLLGIFLVVRFGLPVLKDEKSVPNTISVFYSAAKDYDEGRNFYEFKENMNSNYVYAPFFPVLISKISPVITAKRLTVIWSMVSAISLVTVLAIILFSLLEEGKSLSSVITISVLSIIISWRGLMETMNSGEPDYIIFFILYSSFFLIRTKNRILAGVLSSIALAYKLPFMFVLPMIFYYGGSATLLGFTITSLIWAIVIPFYSFGGDGLIYAYECWNKLIREIPNGMFLSSDNQSIWAMFSRLLPNDQNLAMIAGLSLGITMYIMSFFATIPSSGQSEERNKALDSPLIPTFWLVTYTLLTHSGWRWAFGQWLVVYIYIIFSLERYLREKNIWHKTVYTSLLAISLTIFAIAKKTLITKIVGNWADPYLPELHSAYTLHGLIIFFLFYTLSKEEISFPQIKL